MRQIPERVSQKLETLPDKPGCYQMHNADGQVIYVGKAIVLRNRVRSYFHASAQHNPKTQALVEEIADITWWVTATELEALVLENELIKRYKPRYNVRLKDDKNFPYIKVNWQNDFPKIEVVRKVQKDGARYFGPYTSGRACYQTLDALRRIFPYLDCDRIITGQDARPCLYYHIKMCGGPCIGRQNREEYRQTIRQLMDFLSGETDRVLKQLASQMERAAENMQFELAALYRDRLKSAQQIAEQQKIVAATLEDADYIALAQDERTGNTAIQLFMVRRGRLLGRESVMMEGFEAPPPDEGQPVDLQGTAIGAFIQQFYDNVVFIPNLILVQTMPADWAVLEQWLGEKRGSKVELRTPQRGAKRQLLELAQANAAEYLRVQQAEWAADTNRQTNAVAELQAALGLEKPPARIECFDISTFQGTNTVGSMVVFAKGAPLKSAYKRFKIQGKGSQGAPDDFASMHEMLRRRFRRVVEEFNQTDPGAKTRNEDESWRVLPDLVIIDGGKGQLGVAVDVLNEFGLLDRIPVVGLAKREEEIFRPGESHPIWLKRGSEALHLVQRIRDEAHRFAITYHRNLRQKEQTHSKLDDIKGIGPARRKALLQYFAGDLEKMRNASIEELLAVPGMNRRSAEALKAQL
jgi:excinuclease ABC subunit C